MCSVLYVSMCVYTITMTYGRARVWSRDSRPS